VESVTGTARYAPQIRAYADHWSAQLGTTTRAGLHFIRSGETLALVGSSQLSYSEIRYERGDRSRR
jgi:hypothetical protein